MNMPLTDIVTCKIHPGIGIARLGNSQTEFFIGPEIPGVFEPPVGGYKEAGNPAAVKRQAARFRIYGYDSHGKVVQEITADEAQIEWTVHLANKKAEWHEFQGPDGEQSFLTSPRRNSDIANRRSLILDPGADTVTGRNDRKELSDLLRVAQPPLNVTLGEIRTDDKGRLLVLGGLGRSGSWKPANSIINYANNNGWFDDVSDGPVAAKVTLNNGRHVTVAPSWVIVAPPDFAPAISNVVTLYDVLYEVALARNFIAPPARISFKKHILPILSRPVLLQWVNSTAFTGHGVGKKGDFLTNAKWRDLSNNSSQAHDLRKRVFSRLRNPNLDPQSQEAIKQADEFFMPRLSGDRGDESEGNVGTFLTLTKTQYEWMEQWVEGNFDADGDNLSNAIDPEGLDRAALEACAGGAFFPGIESGWFMRRASIYKEAFRIDHDYLDEFDPAHTKIGAGDISKRMAIPWQADFFECRQDWWPAQRPDDVLTLANFEEVRQLDIELANLTPGTTAFQKKKTKRDKIWARRLLWARSLPQDSPAGDNEMVKQWSRLGFIVDRKDGTPFDLNGQPQFVETERDPTL
jgi:L-Lysine epsilon oxidase N-terminal/L-lysine epsilon oxidase C-terminal domain